MDKFWTAVALLPLSRNRTTHPISNSPTYGKQRKLQAKRRAHAASRPAALPTMILSWLVPGYGFMRNGYAVRGVIFFVLLQLTFLIGAALRGSVLIPELNFREPGFNLVNVLMFITQAFNGGMALISMLPEMFGAGAAILPYEEAAPFADLGAFYLLVSGGMNYFVIVHTYDKFYGPKAIDSIGSAAVVR